MSNVIAIDLESIKRAEECSVQSLPCEIDYSGQAKVQEYFLSTINASSVLKNGLTATFRGRPLDGEIKDVPSGYTGIVMKENRKVYTDEEERNLTATQKFSKFHFWNLDKKPSQDDKLQQTLDWIEIAKTLCLVYLQKTDQILSFSGDKLQYQRI